MRKGGFTKKDYNLFKRLVADKATVPEICQAVNVLEDVVRGALDHLKASQNQTSKAPAKTPTKAKAKPKANEFMD